MNTALNFHPTITAQIKTKEENGNVLVWELIRKKWLVCTPEEWVRQHCLVQLAELGYPLSGMSTEAGVKVVHRSKRTDIVSYLKGAPIILVECKAPHVKLSQDTFDQAFRYNQSIGAPYIWITNGLQHLSWDCLAQKQLTEIPLAESIR